MKLAQIDVAAELKSQLKNAQRALENITALRDKKIVMVSINVISHDVETHIPLSPELLTIMIMDQRRELQRIADALKSLGIEDV